MTSKMFNSPSREQPEPQYRTPLTSETDLRGNSANLKTNSSKQLDKDDLVEHYRVFKMKLLMAMKDMDPLALLQSGIFEEYEETMGHSSMNKVEKPHQQLFNSPFQVQEQCYESKFNKYRISKHMEITQLERRSRSCQRISRQDRAIRRLEEERNIEFILFASALKSIQSKQSNFQLHLHEEDPSISDNIRDITSEKSKLWDNSLFLQELTTLKNQNQKLSLELTEMKSMLQNQKLISATVTQSHNDRQLEYLLKEKQLCKKLREAKQEIDILRESIEKQHQIRLPSNAMTDAELGGKKDKAEGLMGIRDRIEVEGKVRKALGRAWGAQLWMQE